MKLNKQSAAMIRILLFSIGLILSCNVFAKNVTDTNAGTLCDAGQYLDGDGSCKAIPVDTDTNTNAGTLCSVGQYLAGDGSCKAIPVDTDTNTNTNAGTLCDEGQYLAGGGSCIAIPENLPELPLERFETVLRICSNSNTPQWEPCLLLYGIGDTGPAGGIVFHVTNDGLHGLEAAPAGWYGGGADPALAWTSTSTEGCYGTLTGANKTAIGTGAQNTADILAACSASGIAAEIADAYELNGYTDWFLPSKDELYALYLQKDVVGGFAGKYYWSSSESSTSHAWLQGFGDGYQGTASLSYGGRVRAVRAF